MKRSTWILTAHWWASHQWHTIARAAPFVVALTAILVSSFPVAAISLTGATWREMCAEADLIVSARVVSLRSEANSEPHTYGVRTRMALENVRVLSGKTSTERLAVLLPGGTLDGKRVRIPGAPAFKSGEEVVLFLRTSDVSGDDYFLLGHALGVLRCRDGRVIPDIPLEKGPSSRGESRTEFLKRFSQTVPAAISSDSTASQNSHGILLWICVAADLVIAALLLAFAVKRRRRRLALIVLLSASIAPLSAVFSGKVSADSAPFQYVLEGSSWDLNSPLSARVENGRILWVEGKAAKGTPADVTFAAINSMFEQWASDPASALAFAQKGVTLEFGSANDGRNVVSFSTNPPRSIFDKRTLAVTYTIETDDNLHFLDCDIVFNDRDFTWVDSNDPTDRKSLGSVALHEIGHLLGLAHSPDITNVMYAIAQGHRVLSDSDKAGARFLYPRQFHFGKAVATASPTAGVAPLNVAFYSDESITSTGGPPVVSWDFGDGSPTSTQLDPQHVYASPGIYTATLSLLDAAGTSTAPVTIRVDAGGGAVTVNSFSVQASLIVANKGSDKLNFSLSGLKLATGDALHISIGGLSFDASTGGSSGGHGGTTGITRATQAIVLDSKLSFSGVVLGGNLQARFDPKKQSFSLKLAGAQLGRVFDVRGPSDLSRAGKGTLPLQIEVLNGDGSAAAYLSAINFTYQIRMGRTSEGVFEKTVLGKTP